MITTQEIEKMILAGLPGCRVAVSDMMGTGDHFEVTVEAKDFAGQFKQAMKNILSVLAEANGRPEHVVRLTWYVLDMDEYLACRRELGAAYRAVLGDHFPAMALVQVGRLFEPEARLEIEATAVVP